MDLNMTRIRKNKVYFFLNTLYLTIIKDTELLNIKKYYLNDKISRIEKYSQNFKNLKTLKN